MMLQNIYRPDNDEAVFVAAWSHVILFSDKFAPLILRFFLKKMGQSRPLLFIFVLILLQFQYKLKKA